MKGKLGKMKLDLSLLTVLLVIVVLVLTIVLVYKQSEGFYGDGANFNEENEGNANTVKKIADQSVVMAEQSEELVEQSEEAASIVKKMADKINELDTVDINSEQYSMLKNEINQMGVQLTSIQDSVTNTKNKIQQEKQEIEILEEQFKKPEGVNNVSGGEMQDGVNNMSVGEMQEEGVNNLSGFNQDVLPQCNLNIKLHKATIGELMACMGPGPEPGMEMEMNQVMGMGQNGQNQVMGQNGQNQVMGQNGQNQVMGQNGQNQGMVNSV